MVNVYWLKIMMNCLPRDKLTTNQNESSFSFSTIKEDALIIPVERELMSMWPTRLMHLI